MAQEDRSKGKIAPQEWRRQHGLLALGTEVPRLTKRLCRRRGFADASLLVEWPRIVGNDIAHRCRPVRLTFEDRQVRREGTLLLRTSSGFAIELQHLAPLLIDRINSFFGYKAVSKISFHQGPLPPLPGKHRRLSPGTAPRQVIDKLNSKLHSVEDPDLKQALDRLGRSFYAREHKTDEN